ncbi:MAG: AraC family transcriptional regulator [Bacteroidales bacterium]|nr:AraC family transcriptional regulator [Bacteroidales bacterium]MCF8397246.1 AraC family transcriptional regulator [Bacteroidales bacterium]
MRSVRNKGKLFSFAHEVGYKSKSVFNSAFKKYTGLTPSFYLNYLKENQ